MTKTKSKLFFFKFLFFFPLPHVSSIKIRNKKYAEHCFAQTHFTERNKHTKYDKTMNLNKEEQKIRKIKWNRAKEEMKKKLSRIKNVRKKLKKKIGRIIHKTRDWISFKMFSIVSVLFFFSFLRFFFLSFVLLLLLLFFLVYFAHAFVRELKTNDAVFLT